MKSFQDVLIQPQMSLIEAIGVLDRSALQILVVTNDDGKLLATVTDGDIRRGILRGLDLNSSVSGVMNRRPVVIDSCMGRDAAIALMKSRSIHCVPVVDTSGCVVGLETESHLLWQGAEETCVVLMAGGKGMRLRPLTESLPKPLLEVNGKPMLDHIIARFAEQGFRHFFLSVNYKSEMIKDYFGDGAKHGVKISYVDEEKPLGTGGALSRLPLHVLSENIIVMNGDLLTTLNFRQLLDFHRAHGGEATMAVRDYSFRVPYGVVQVDGEQFVEVIEKPAHSYFVNAGIYVLSREQLQHIPKDEFYDLPNLFSQLKAEGKRVTVFPIREEWRDVGSHADYQQANKSQMINKNDE